MLAAPLTGTPNAMVKLDGNLYKSALQHGVTESNGEDKLTECKNLSKAQNKPDVTEGHHDKNIIGQAIWNDHNREVKILLGKS